MTPPGRAMRTISSATALRAASGSSWKVYTQYTMSKLSDGRPVFSAGARRYSTSPVTLLRPVNDR
eukprot:scaffold334_cov241-Pinguiococcus_pyrenoidosus.AAC.32